MQPSPLWAASPATALGPQTCVGGPEKLKVRETSGRNLFPPGPSWTPTHHPRSSVQWVGRSLLTPGCSSWAPGAPRCVSRGVSLEGLGAREVPRALRAPPALEQRDLPLPRASFIRPSLWPYHPWPPKCLCAHFQAMGSGVRALPSHHQPQSLGAPVGFHPAWPAALSAVPPHCLFN